MLMREPTPEMLKEWKAVWQEYKDLLKPNRKSGQELLDYLSRKYVITEIQDKEAAEAVCLNVTMNKPRSEKLPVGAAPQPKTYFVENRGNGCALYKNMDEIYKDVTRIFVGIDRTSGYYMVEGSSMLWDELCAFQGLDPADIQNYYCVAEYIACLKKFGKLEDALR